MSETPKAQGSKSWGLRLTLGNAPHTPHNLVGVPGLYCPHRPTPVGGPGEMSYTEAKELVAAGHPLELVPLDRYDVNELRKLAQADLEEAGQTVSLYRAREILANADFVRTTVTDQAVKEA